MTLLSFLLTMTFCRGVTTAFAPRNKTELHDAVGACLKLSPVGSCSAGPHGPMGSWNVSSITTMTWMFYNARSLNQDLSAWDVSGVISMQRMFYIAQSFNQHLSAWNVSAVANMRGMFAYAQSFNQDLSAWDVSTVTTMAYMFNYAQSFNQDLSAWDVSAVTDMNNMFHTAHSFNQELSEWDVSAVTDMRGMFYTAQSFNQDLSAWDVSAVTNMQAMFYNAQSFNQDLSAWDVSAVTYMNGMFTGAQSFNQDISPWDVSAVTDMSWMFRAATSFDQTLCGVSWVNSKATKDGMFTGSSGSICTTTAATTTRTATTKTIIPTIHTTTTATIATISIPVLVIICVLAVMTIVRARSKRSSGEANPSAIPLIDPDAETMPDADPVFTSATTETNPNTSSTDPVFTSLTDSTNFSNLARSGDQHEQPHQESDPLWWVKPHPGASADILVVDHIKTNRMVATLAAKKSGLTFHLAANGLQALDRMRRNTYSMVFMDREMPIMDGVVATELARANGYTLPIVMTSKNTLEPQERLELKRRGITAFLSITSAPHAMKMLRKMKERL